MPVIAILCHPTWLFHFVRTRNRQDVEKSLNEFDIRNCCKRGIWNNPFVVCGFSMNILSYYMQICNDLQIKVKCQEWYNKNPVTLHHGQCCDAQTVSFLSFSAHALQSPSSHAITHTLPLWLQVHLRSASLTRIIRGCDGMCFRPDDLVECFSINWRPS